MLPDKIRKQHFTREEQVSLMVRCKKVLEHASPELAKDAFCRCLSAARDRVSSESKERPSTSAASTPDEKQSFLTIDSAAQSSSESVNAEVEILKLYSQRDNSQALNQDVVPVPAAAPPQAQPGRLLNTDKPKRKSLHRKHSLTPLPLPPPVLAPPVPPLPPLPSPETARYMSLSLRLSRPFIEPTGVSSDRPVARRDYHDLDARKQLRETIASPEKFDEALAFGFSHNDSVPSAPATDDSFPLQQPPLYHSENEEDDNRSVESQGPRTPTAIPDTEAAIKLPSFDSGTEFPMQQSLRPKTPINRSPTGSVGNSEMTFHMSLTRQDLRSSPEEELYSAQRRKVSGVDVEEVDPLALQVLPVCDDPTGAHGAFAVHGSSPKGLKRVWKTIRRQRSVL